MPSVHRVSERERSTVMRAFHMPSLGDTLVLAADWTFTVVNDSRNRLLIDWAGLASVPSNVYSYFPLGTGQYDVTRNWHELRATTRAVTLPQRYRADYRPHLFAEGIERIRLGDLPWRDSRCETEGPIFRTSRGCQSYCDGGCT